MFFWKWIRWMDYEVPKIAIWRAFLSKTNYFSHLTIPYPANPYPRRAHPPVYLHPTSGRRLQANVFAKTTHSLPNDGRDIAQDSCSDNHSTGRGTLYASSSFVSDTAQSVAAILLEGRKISGDGVACTWARHCHRSLPTCFAPPAGCTASVGCRLYVPRRATLAKPSKLRHATLA
jgi:hypothetical protein